MDAPMWNITVDVGETFDYEIGDWMEDEENSTRTHM